MTSFNATRKDGASGTITAASFVTDGAVDAILTQAEAKAPHKNGD